MIWHKHEDKVKRDSLLLEYHNLRQLVVNTNKDILYETHEESTRVETDLGPSSSSCHCPEELHNARRTLDRLASEEQRSATGRDNESQEDDEPNIGNDNPAPRGENHNDDHQVPDLGSDEHEDGEDIIPVRPQAETGDRSGVELLDPNVTRRVPNPNPIPYNQEPAPNTSYTTANTGTQDVRYHQAMRNTSDNDISQLVTIMARLLEKMSQNQLGNELSPTNSGNGWNDTKDTKRKARRAFSAQFAKKIFSGKFGDNWDRHRERFAKTCVEWEVEESDYVDYLQETLTDDALNYVEGKVKLDRDISWNSLSKLLCRNCYKKYRDLASPSPLHSSVRRQSTSLGGNRRNQTLLLPILRTFLQISPCVGPSYHRTFQRRSSLQIGRKSLAKSKNTYHRNGESSKANAVSSSSNAIGCFNCGRQGCSVAVCKRPRDADRIAKNISRWREVRRMNKSARIHMNNVQELFKSAGEAKEVMLAAVMVNQYENEREDNDEMVDPLARINETLRYNVIQHTETQEDEDDDPFQEVCISQICLIVSPSDQVINVLQTNGRGHRYGRAKFEGACLDTGGQRSVYGLYQARAYANHHLGALTLKKSCMQFKFGEQVARAIGKVNIRVPIKEGTHLALNIDVVDLDLPLIFGLDTLRVQKLLVDYITDTIQYCNHNVKRPITDKMGHVFLVWDENEILFTRGELVRLHTHFMHPSASKLFALVTRADPTKANPSVQRLVEEITSACAICKPYKSALLRFKAAIPSDKIVFNQVVSIDLLWLYDRPVLYVIDEQTGFRSASFIKSKSAEDIWNAFIGCWVSIYVGFASKIRSDQESAVTSEQFRQSASMHGIEIEFSDISSHNSMGQIESAHGALRRIYKMLPENYTGLSDTLRLRFAIKELNDTTGIKGLVPSLLVFGTIPSLENAGANLLDQEERFKAMYAARKEAAAIVAEQRIRLALKSNAPPSAKYSLKICQRVMVFSENQQKWVRDLIVIHLSSKQVWMSTGKRVHQVNRTHVIPQVRAEDNTGISHLLRRLSPLNSQSHPNILLTEILTPNDPRGETASFDLAKAKEIVGLLDKGAFRVVLKEDLDHDANILGGRFVLMMKHKDTDNELFKARFVVQGHLDRDKDFLVHASTTISQQAIKLLVSLATICRFKLWSEDMTLAHIQGADKILRKVYMKGKPEFQLSSDQLLEILKPLYGLSHSGDYWHATFMKQTKNDLGIKSTGCNLSLFCKQVHGSLYGLIATHVEDTLSAGNHKFEV